ncbi:MAG: histidine kinase [Bacteroidales bacterium]|nr:histidine kinase [Bacteroidales bacterium]
MPQIITGSFSWRMAYQIFIPILLLLYFQCTSQEYICTDKLSSSDGLSQSTVNCLLQDDDGLLWIGTQDGLNLYDGNEFIFFHNQPGDTTSLSDNYILSICKDSNDNIWLGTMSGGLNKFNKKTYSCERFQKNPNKKGGISDNTVWAVQCDAGGNIYAGTNAGLNVLDIYTNQFKTYTKNDTILNTLPSDMITSLLIDNNNKIWIGTNEGLAIFNKDLMNFKLVSPNVQIPDINMIVWTVVELQNNQILAGTNRGIWKVNQTLNQLEAHNYEGLNNTIWSVASLTKNTLLAGTRPGLFYINQISREIEEITFQQSGSNSPENNNIWSIIQDQAGFFWAGSDEGLMKIKARQNSFQTLNAKPTNDLFLSGPSVNAILVDSEQSLWIGTDGAGLNMLEQGRDRFDVYRANSSQNHSLSNNRVWALLEDKDGIIWVGAYGGGLNSFNKLTKTFKTYRHENRANSISNNRVMALFEDNGGFIWIGTRGGGLNKFDKTKEVFTTYLHDQNDSTSLISNTVLSINEDRQGNLWIGTYLGGLSKFNRAGQTFTNYCFRENERGCISNNNVWSVLFDKKDRMWIGTQGGLNWSLNNPDSMFFNHITTKQGLPSNVIFGIVEDQKGNIWMSTFRGIAKLSNQKSDWLFEEWDNDAPAEPEPFDPIIISYTEHDGIHGNEFNQGASFIDSKGAIYYGGLKGLTMFHPDSLQFSRFNPRVILTGFKIFNKKVEIGESQEKATNKIVKSGNTYYLPEKITYLKNLELTYKESVFSFQFSSLDFTNPTQNNYAYKMDGFEPGWNYVGTQNSATYTNLDAGNYTFRVKGTNADGKWSTHEATLNINILPPFWKTPWFIALFVLAFLVALTLVIFRIIFVQKRHARAEREKIELQLKTIKNQIDPHFAFNAINMIGSLVYKNDPDTVYDYFSRFAHLIRSTLRDSEKISRTLSEELEFVKNYIEIQKTRFKNKFDFELFISENTNLETEVPKMIIQTYVENAIKHGLMNKKSKGTISISIRQEGERLMISVKDDGIGRKKAAEFNKDSTKKGMAIIRQIFDLYRKIFRYQIKQEIIDLHDGNGKPIGTEVKLTIIKSC